MSHTSMSGSVPDPSCAIQPEISPPLAPSISEMPEGPDLYSVPNAATETLTGDENLIASHLDHMATILALPPGESRAVAATNYLATLEDCRRDAIAVRDVSVWLMKTTAGLGGVRIAAALRLNASRGQQLIYRAQETHPAAAQHIAKLRRRLGAVERSTEPKPTQSSQPESSQTESS